MKHLPDERLFLLGLDASEQPTHDEAAHLNKCAGCAERLNEESRLSSELETLPVAEAPPHFVDATVARFALAQGRRRSRHTVLAFALAMIAGLFVTVPLLAIVLVNGDAVIAGIATAAQQLVVIGEAVGVVFSKLPILPLMLTAATGTACMLIAAFINRLAVATANWK